MFGSDPAPGRLHQPELRVVLPADIAFRAGSAMLERASTGMHETFRDPDSVTVLADGSSQLVWQIDDLDYDSGTDVLRFHVEAQTSNVRTYFGATLQGLDATDASQRGVTVGSVYSYRSVDYGGCINMYQFFKGVGDQALRSGTEFQSYRGHEVIPWHLYAVANDGAVLRDVELLDRLPLGIEIIPDSGVFTITQSDGTVIIIDHDDPDYPEEIITVASDGQQSITWRSETLFSEIRSVRLTFESQAQSGVETGVDLVNQAYVSASNLHEEHCGLAQSLCDTAGVHILSEDSPSIQKRVLSGMDGTWGDSAEFLVTVTLPSGQAFEDLHIMDSLPYIYDRITTRSLEDISASCVSGCSSPTEIPITRLSNQTTTFPISSHPSIHSTGWWFGDIASSANQRVIEIRYRVDTGYANMVPTAALAQSTSLTNQVRLRTFPSSADRTDLFAGQG